MITPPIKQTHWIATTHQPPLRLTITTTARHYHHSPPPPPPPATHVLQGACSTLPNICTPPSPSSGTLVRRSGHVLQLYFANHHGCAIGLPAGHSRRLTPLAQQLRQTAEKPGKRCVRSPLAYTAKTNPSGACFRSFPLLVFVLRVIMYIQWHVFGPD
jgi:hypothetical protein